MQEAVAVAQELYGERMHWSGETVMQHVLGVTEVLMRFSPDADTVIATILHHALDDGRWSAVDLEKRFGRDVRTIVRGIHLLSRIEVNSRRMSIDNLRLMFLRISSDLRVVLVVLCAKAYAMRRIDAVSPKERVGLCRDVLRLYAPVAARLGIYALKHELEELAFPIAHPTDSELIGEQLDRLKQKSGRFLEKSASAVMKFLRQNGVRARVEVREKQPYSIFIKMDRKSLSAIHDLYDLFAIRVIVGDETQCYQTLGLLHHIGHPVPNRFKDYIAFPKPNGYQSLHTTLAQLPEVPEGMLVEVQIRTERMHVESEYGIAAHWSYKERGSVRTQAAGGETIHRLVSLKEDVEKGRRPSLRDNIFVLTPKGEVFELPEGATPLDFAFHLHTEVGISFRAARVNGSIVPMEYRLTNGDIVEVLKQREPHPSPRWLNLLKTASARSRLKRYLATKDRLMSLARGRDLLNAELRKRQHEPLDPDYTVLRTLEGKRTTVAAREEFVSKVGTGQIKLASAILQIDELHTVTHQRAVKGKVDKPSPLGVRIEGGVPLPHRFARCCKPDDARSVALLGVIGRNGEVCIHRKTCRLLKNVNPERHIGVKWVKGE